MLSIFKLESSTVWYMYISYIHTILQSCRSQPLSEGCGLCQQQCDSHHWDWGDWWYIQQWTPVHHWQEAMLSDSTRQIWRVVLSWWDDSCSRTTAKSYNIQQSPTTFSRTRGDDGTVNLNRINDVMTPAGLFCCVVPDATNTSTTTCINIGEKNKFITDATDVEQTICVNIGIIELACRSLCAIVMGKLQVKSFFRGIG